MYRAQLDCAMDAALAAGAMLREEFNHPGGPRAQDLDHASVDEEAERVIRTRIRKARDSGAAGHAGASVGS